jgi:flagellin-like hook-associated protein FlgL
MKLSLNTNIGSLTAQNQLLKASEKLQTSFERLSSGLRINRASDDPAGLAMASALQTDSRLMAQAVRNVNDGLSAVNIIQGALEQLSIISTRQSELATQAANGVYSLEQRKVMNTEANALVEEFNRIVNTTEFNGINLLDGSQTALNLQAGTRMDALVSFGITDLLARSVGDGTFTESATHNVGIHPTFVQLVDINNNGILDMVTAGGLAGSGNVSVSLGNGDGTFKARASYVIGPIQREFAVGDLNGDGILDIVTANYGETTSNVLIGAGNGTFSLGLSFEVGTNPFSVALGDLNGDGTLDMAVADVNGDAAATLIGNGNGTFQSKTTFQAGIDPCAVRLADFNSDGILDMVTIDRGSARASIYIGNGDGTFNSRASYLPGNNTTSVAIGDLNGDGILDLATSSYGGPISILTGNGNGTFAPRVTYENSTGTNFINLTDINGDGILDAITANRTSNSISVFLGNSDGTFNQRTTNYSASPFSVATGDVNGDGGIDIVSASINSHLMAILSANCIKDSTIPKLNLLTQEGALEAISTVDATLQRIGLEAGSVGATQSRLGFIVNQLQVMQENYTTASGRIMDADIAEEVAQMVRQQILQQAITAVMAQANQQSALVLQLLK